MPLHIASGLLSCTHHGMQNMRQSRTGALLAPASNEAVTTGNALEAGLQSEVCISLALSLQPTQHPHG
jgi:hypothetical protein